jgi:hypothetical protein
MAISRGVTLKLEGAKELEAALRELPKRIGKNVIKRALTKAAEPMLRQAQQNAARTKPALGEKGVNLSTVLSRRQKRGIKARDGNTVYLFLGANSARWGIAHLIEFGTSMRAHKSGKSTGRMAAQPWLRDAWAAYKQQTLDNFGKYLWQEIDKAAKSLARRQARAARGS